jgi:undecaprenyl-diphosphatase
MNSFDLTVFHFINQFAGHLPIMDALLSFIAQYALEIYALLFIVAWFTLPKTDERYRHGLVVTVLGGVLALIINVVIAHVWYRDRPFVVLPKGTFTQLIPHSIDSSFPSDHGSGSFAFAAGTWGKTAKWTSRTFTILAFVVSFSRVYAGVHWPTDVMASFVVGTLSGRVIWKLSPVIRPLTNVGLNLFKFGQYAGSKKVS